MSDWDEAKGVTCPGCGQEVFRLATDVCPGCEALRLELKEDLSLLKRQGVHIPATLHRLLTLFVPRGFWTPELAQALAEAAIIDGEMAEKPTQPLTTEQKMRFLASCGITPTKGTTSVSKFWEAYYDKRPLTACETSIRGMLDKVQLPPDASRDGLVKAIVASNMTSPWPQGKAKPYIEEAFRAVTELPLFSSP